MGEGLTKAAATRPRPSPRAASCIRAPAAGEKACPLSPALQRLLQAAWDLETTGDRELASALCVSRHTIRTEFERAFDLLNVHGRSAAVIVAAKRHWIATSPGTPSVRAASRAEA